MGNMLIYVIIAIFFILLIVTSVYIILLFNKLKQYQNEVNKLWDDLRTRIERQFLFIETNLNYLNDQAIVELVNSYKIEAYTENVMKDYVDLEKLIDNNSDNEIKSVFLKNDSEIENIKTDYNNILLKYNNLIDMIPNKIFANMLGFKEGVYFISKK